MSLWSANGTLGTKLRQFKVWRNPPQNDEVRWIWCMSILWVVNLGCMGTFVNQDYSWATWGFSFPLAGNGNWAELGIARQKIPSLSKYGFILLMEEILHQLIYVVCPILYQVFFHIRSDRRISEPSSSVSPTFPKAKRFSEWRVIQQMWLQKFWFLVPFNGRFFTTQKSGRISK